MGVRRVAPLQQSGLLETERAGSGAQQLAGARVVEGEGGLVDADADLAAGQDLRGEKAVPPKASVTPRGSAVRSHVLAAAGP
jgi:hypothetical protein